MNKDEKKLFELEQQLDIPYKDRYYNKDDKRNYEAQQPVKNCSIPYVVGQSEQLLEEQSNWLMANTSLEVEKIVDFKEYFKQYFINYERNKTN